MPSRGESGVRTMAGVQAVSKFRASWNAEAMSLAHAACWSHACLEGVEYSLASTHAECLQTRTLRQTRTPQNAELPQ